VVSGPFEKITFFGPDPLSTGYELFSDVLPKFSRTLSKSIKGLLQFEDVSCPILRILRETQRHFHINIFTWFKSP
jgi:hypothetical protein